MLQHHGTAEAKNWLASLCFEILEDLKKPKIQKERKKQKQSIDTTDSPHNCLASCNILL